MDEGPELARDGTKGAPTPAPRRTRALWFAGLAALTGAGIVGWVSLNAFRILTHRPTPRKVRYHVPGLRIDLPPWEPSEDQRDRVPGRMILRSEDDTHRLMLAWEPGSEMDDGALQRRLVWDDHRLVDSRYVRVADGEATLFYSTGPKEERQVAGSFLCRGPYVRFLLRVLAPLGQEALFAMAETLLATARCDRSTLTNVRVRRLPLLTRCADCALPELLFNAAVIQCEGEGTYSLERGHFGRLTRAEEAELVHSRLGTLLVSPPDGNQLGAALETAPPRGRTVHRAEGHDHEGHAARVLWTVFHCQDVDQTFLATYEGHPDEDDRPHLDRLETLKCPSRLPARNVLDEEALRVEAFVVEPGTD